MGAQADAIGRSLRAGIQNAAKALTLQIARELRLNPSRGGTPVDTGHARANWVPTVGEPYAEEAAGDDAAAYQQGAAQIVGYLLEQGPLWVANNVPYIQSLNYGHSKQAPALFVEAAIDRALARVEELFGSGALGFSRSEFQSAVGSSGADNLAAAYNPLGGDVDD